MRPTRRAIARRVGRLRLGLASAAGRAAGCTLRMRSRRSTRFTALSRALPPWPEVGHARAWKAGAHGVRGGRSGSLVAAAAAVDAPGIAAPAIEIAARRTLGAVDADAGFSRELRSLTLARRSDAASRHEHVRAPTLSGAPRTLPRAAIGPFDPRDATAWIHRPYRPLPGTETGSQRSRCYSSGGRSAPSYARRAQARRLLLAGRALNNLAPVDAMQAGECLVWMPG